MALRLVLVGVVAGLGFTLPSGEQLASWKASSQTWVTSRLAEWDAQATADGDAYVLVAEPTPTLADAPAITPATRPETTPRADAAVPATPAAVKEAVTHSPADLAAGLEVPQAPVALDDSAPTSSAPTTAPPADLDRVFNAAQGEVLSAFARDFAGPSEMSPAPVAAAPAWRYEPPTVGEDLYEGTAFALNRGAEGSPSGTPATPVAGITGPSAAEPPAVDDDLYPGIAYALNREAEGLRPQDSSPPRQDRLTQAVRLTREAAQAWANLLSGPAVVILSH